MLLTPYYAALLALLYLALSIRTIRVRRQHRVPVGDGGAAALARAMRAHGNFAEYVPLTLLLLFFVETGGASPLWVQLLSGRCLHAYGISQPQEDYRYRVSGMSLTFGALSGAAVLILAQGLLG